MRITAGWMSKTMARGSRSRTGRKCSRLLPGWMIAEPEPQVVMVWGCLLCGAFFIGMVGRPLSGAATNWVVPDSAWSGQGVSRMMPFCEPVLMTSPDVTKLYRIATEQVGNRVENRKCKG